MQWVARLRQAPVTSSLLVINTAVFLVMVAVSHQVLNFDAETLAVAGASVRAQGFPFSAWRWLSAAYVHGGLLHIVMNMFVLAQIGALAEAVIGRGLFAALYVVAGVAGFALSYAMGAPAAKISVGASGAIMGLIGVSAVFAWRTGQSAIARNLLTNVGFIFVVGLFANVDNYAHLGGLLVGAAAGLWRARWTRPLPRFVDGALIGLSAALSIAALVIVHLQAARL